MFHGTGQFQPIPLLWLPRVVSLLSPSPGLCETPLPPLAWTLGSSSLPSSFNRMPQHMGYREWQKISEP